ncbi:MAG: phosphate/phosphite/phosphonate ABC transporter substrate-binding protein [Robiginitomaculum sp.]|nr:phosphate/phosphite/phosphonate ABC transporter substrate-binding protein [Robiginitomaculum sp.]
MNKLLIISIIIGISLVAGLISYSTIEEIPQEGIEKIKIDPVEVISSDTIPLRIGTIGDSATKLIFRFQPTATYLAEQLSDDQTKYDGKVVIAESVENMISLIDNNEIDLFLESPFTTISIMDKTDIKPLLVRWKQGASSYHTVFLSTTNSNISSLQDEKIKTWIFESRESSSGYLLPLSHMYQNNILNESFDDRFKFVFSGEDKNTGVWLLEGKGDVGAMSNLDFDDLPDSIKTDLIIIDETIDVSRHVVSFNSNMDSIMVDKIHEIFLNMKNDPEGLEIMLDFKNTINYSEYDESEILVIKKMLDNIVIGIT